MINTSVEIADNSGLIRASVFRKLDLYEPLIEVMIEHFPLEFRGQTFDDDAGQMRFLLERGEAISFGHALIALGESL